MDMVRVGVCGMTGEVGALLSRHYAAGKPARVCRVLGAWMDEELVGVLTVSHPTLNDSWRSAAWPGVFDVKDKRARAARLNELVRRISRVVVAERRRGCGVGTALVSAYLRRPLTAYTEAIAAMGEYCGCFERAGMRAVVCGVRARDAKLAGELRAMRIRPETLVDEACARKWAKRPEFVAALRRWVNASGATRKMLKRETWLLDAAPVAARAMVVSARVWVGGGEIADGRGAKE